MWRFLKKLEIELPYDPAIPLLGIHTEETRSERDTCTPMFITALFIIARTWKQPRCPSADKWIGKLWFSSVQFSSVAQSCPTLCDPMNHSTPGLPVHHQLLESTQTHACRVMMPSSHLIFCCPLLLLSPIPPCIRVFSNESTLHMRWLKYWGFSCSISPSNEHPGLISSFRMDWLDLLAVQGTLRIFSNTTVQKRQFFSAQLSL